MPRTIVYVDGFNLYYRSLKRTQHKWLNLFTFSEAILPNDHTITRINYYTARVSARISPEAPKDQNTYLSALNTIDEVSIHLGSFQVNKTWMFMSQPPAFLPSCEYIIEPEPRSVSVIKTEEKGSDVNLGAHLVRDALRGHFEHAAVITNDTDLVEPIRIVIEEAGLPVTLITPVKKPAKSLSSLATHVRHIRNGHLAASQFPDEISSSDGRKICKPDGW